MSKKPKQKQKRVTPAVTLTIDPALMAEVRARGQAENKKYTAIVEDALKFYFAHTKGSVTP